MSLLNPNDAYPIKNEVRKLMLTIYGDGANYDAFGTAMHYLDCHFPAEKLEAALSWLVRNKLTGKRFDQFLAHDCDGSRLELHKILLTKVEGLRGSEAKSRLVLAGNDFR